METEYQVKFVGCSESQSRWGGPYGDHSKLEVNKIYTVIDKEIHSQHTKLFLEETGECYNSVCFERV